MRFHRQRHKMVGTIIKYFICIILLKNKFATKLVYSASLSTGLSRPLYERRMRLDVGLGSRDTDGSGRISAVVRPIRQADSAVVAGLELPIFQLSFVFCPFVNCFGYFLSYE